MTLAEGNYTLSELERELQTKLNGVRESSDVSHIAFVATSDLKHNTIRISLASTANPDICCKVYTDAEVVRDIRNSWTTVDPGNLRSANDVITGVARTPS